MSNTAPPPPPPQSPPPPSSPAQPASQWGPPSGSASKAGMPMWGKIALGCGCLALIIGALLVATIGFGVKKAAESLDESGIEIGKAFEAAKAFSENDPARAAEAIIELNPEFEVVENDPDNGRIKVRMKSTDEIGTIDYSQLEQGKFTFESDGGASFKIDGSEGSDSAITYTDSEGNTGTIGLAQELPAFVPLYPGANAQEGGGFQAEHDGNISGLQNFNTNDTFDDVVQWYEENLETQGYTVERSSVNTDQTQSVLFNCNKDGVDQLSIAVSQETGQQVSILAQYSGAKN